MWTFDAEVLNAIRGVKISVFRETKRATFGDVLHGWCDDEDFRSQFNAQLSGVPYTAFRWENPGLVKSALSNLFECVVLDCPSLARAPEPNAFAEHFHGSKADVVVFSNLGGDATMVVPYPLSAICAYPHLAAFVRNAPDGQRHSLWQAVGKTMLDRVGTKPVWLSTAGAGVAWLHVRLDDRPKYYGYAAYRLIS